MSQTHAGLGALTVLDSDVAKYTFFIKTLFLLIWNGFIVTFYMY